MSQTYFNRISFITTWWEHRGGSDYCPPWGASCYEKEVFYLVLGSDVTGDNTKLRAHAHLK